MKYYIYVPHPDNVNAIVLWEPVSTISGYKTVGEASNAFWDVAVTPAEEVIEITLIRLPDWICPPETLETWTGWARRTDWRNLPDKLGG